ncbi:hypothetical protein MS3_00000820 [Schistosoma haematobium]|uniref:Uncharacterized protein n=1 Tax=Schistosoma haematobium TaxID=6185 RepID=A0A922S5S6_SCHHA|nr:hypothetical protein MS3_00000820 [Schistosoma haematobium]KAH9595216.1 hypothetical protein MS3_00000820 [Schistosoma haematobium]CAH8461047.1 unnamed protein product [Schistosoma haematobium]
MGYFDEDFPATFLRYENSVIPKTSLNFGAFVSYCSLSNVGRLDLLKVIDIVAFLFVTVQCHKSHGLGKLDQFQFSFSLGRTGGSMAYVSPGNGGLSVDPTFF